MQPRGEHILNVAISSSGQTCEITWRFAVPPLNGIALTDAAVNVISRFGQYGAAVSLGYSGIKKSAGILTNLEYQLRDQFNIMQKDYIRMMGGGF